MTEKANRPRIISFKDTEGFDRGDFQDQVYVAKEEEVGFNALAVFVNGKHPIKQLGEQTTRTYLVVEGEGTFGLEGVNRPVSQGDMIVIPPKQRYQYEGVMTLFEVNVSPDNSFTDQKI
ncbi:MAG TPA: hypothetical protein VJJ78_04550 [Candidatus Saccharimonadales bacterium]|nr:hypothetical protein [Candidatus Saccharimonadales bacterium]